MLRLCSVELPDSVQRLYRQPPGGGAAHRAGGAAAAL